jgi:hypothetical protein
MRPDPHAEIEGFPLVNAGQSGAGDKPVRRNPNRRVIDCRCTVHGARRRAGFVPLVCTKRDGDIELNPHATDQCMILLDEKAANALFDVLGEWLGC